MPADPWAAFRVSTPAAAGPAPAADEWAAFRAAPAPIAVAPAESSWLDTAGDFLTGAAKGAGSTIYGLGKFVNENSFIGAQTGGYPEKPNELKPEGTAQDLGFGAEQIGEFFIPGGAVTKAGKGAGLLTRIGLEAATQGGVAAAQSGGDPRQTGIAAALGAVGPLAAKGAEAAGPLIQRAAETQYGRALAATTTRMKDTSARIVPELLKRHVRGSLETLAEKGAELSKAEGVKLEKAYAEASNAGVKSRTAPVIADLEKVKDRFFATNDAGVKIPVNPVAIAKLEAAQELIGKFGDTARPDQLWAMRKNIDDIIEGAGGFGGPATPGTTKALQRETRTAIQRELNRASPDIAKINKEFSLWKGLEEVSAATLKRKVGQAGIVELGIRSSVGGGLGLLLGDDPKWGTVGAALGAVTKHPLYRTVSASEKARLAHALAQGQATTASSILTKILAGFSTAALDDESPTRRP